MTRHKLEDATKENTDWNDSDCNTCLLNTWTACDEICKSKSTLIKQIAEDKAEIDHLTKELKEINEYLDMCGGFEGITKAFRERDAAVAVEPLKEKTDWGMGYKCPCCTRSIFHYSKSDVGRHKHCSNCGQKLDWSEIGK